MSGGKVFVISFFTSLIVSIGVAGFIHYGPVKLQLAEEPVEPVAELKPVETIEVPNVVGLDVDEAQTVISGRGLTVGKVEQVEKDDVPAGKVVQTDPPRFAKVNPGTTVALEISKGISKVKVPNVRRMTKRKATKAMEAAGLVVEYKNIVNEDMAFDRVVRQ